MVVWSARAFWLSVLSSVMAMPVAAQDVLLRSFDGQVVLEGTLTAFDGTYYQLQSIYGPLTVAAEGVACAGPGCPDLMSFTAEARIAGEATVTETLLPALLQGFAADRAMALLGPEPASGAISYALTRQDGGVAARFHVIPGNSDSAFLALLNGETDMALTLRRPTLGEDRADRASAPDDPPLARRVRVIALDALVPLVGPGNPLDGISLEDLTAAFRGDITSWQDLGGDDALIALHMLRPEHGMAQFFTALALGGVDGDLTPGITYHDSVLALADAVARDNFALGVTARSSEAGARVLPLIGACGLVQSAAPDAIKAEDYPLTVPVHVYLAPRRLPQLVQDFLDWTETAHAEAIVAATGFVDQRLTRTPIDRQGMRLANAIAAAGPEVTLEQLQALVAALRGAERLSATLRFADGSTELDAQSRAAVARLAAAIENGAFDGRRLIFVGFSDSAGAAEANLRVARRRAETVRDAVRAAADAADPGRVTLEVAGFGEAMPMACEDSAQGRAVNRRVEVWLD